MCTRALAYARGRELLQCTRFPAPPFNGHGDERPWRVPWTACLTHATSRRVRIDACGGMSSRYRHRVAQRTTFPLQDAFRRLTRSSTMASVSNELPVMHDRYGMA